MTHAWEQWEYRDERAAILEYDAGYTREEAERIAGEEMVRKFRSVWYQQRVLFE